MKLAFLLFLPLFLTLSHAEIIGVEQFDYPDGAIAEKNGGTFWDYDNVSPEHTGTASNWDSPVGTPNVTSGRLVTSGNSVAKREYNGSSQDSGAVNDVNVAKKVFYRVSVTTGATVGESDYFGFSSLDFEDEKLYFGKSGGSTNFGVENVGMNSNASSVAILPNKTYLLVAVVDFENDSIRLYVDPVLNGSEPVAAAAALPYTGTNWSTAVRFASDTSVSWDDLVVATSWEDLGTVVTTDADENDGNLTGIVSLREAVNHSPAGSLITFAPGLSGKTLTLTHSDGDMVIDKAVTIDASALPDGITLDGNNTSRHFEVQSGKNLTLSGLTLTGGNVVGTGGAISNQGTLILTQCSLLGNRASHDAGALFNSSGTMTLTHCTLFGNSSGIRGGAIYNFQGTLNLVHCTVSGNSAGIVSGAILNQGPMTLNHTIVSGNAAPDDPDISQVDSLTRTGVNLIGNLAGSGLSGSATLLTGDAKLSPLGYFGGPVQTMHPLIGSPAIDGAGETDPGGTDARGFPRFVDGDTSSPDAQLDIGAVEAGPLRMVNFTSDLGASSSLRGRIASSVEPGARIGFLTDPNMPIVLGSELNIPAGRSLFIDASNLSAPVTISGNNQFRVFNLPATATAAMHSLRIVNGQAPNGFSQVGSVADGENGGGILNAGSLSLFSSTISGNRSGNGAAGSLAKPTSGGAGGGIFSSGLLSLTACTVSGNVTGNGASGEDGSGFGAGNGGSGGGICCSGSLSLTACTLSANLTGHGGPGRDNDNPAGVGGNGGGIFSAGALQITTCTLSGNIAGNGGNHRVVFDSSNQAGNGGSGGGIFKSGSASCRLIACTLSGNRSGAAGTSLVAGGSAVAGTGGGVSTNFANFENCLIVGNTIGATATAQDVKSGHVDYVGANLLSIAATQTTFTGPAPIIDANPLLASLGDYGGPTQTMPPLPGSPAINAATGSTRLTDQRGFPLFGVPEIGAVEIQSFGPIPNLNTTEDTAVTSAPFAVGGIGVLLATSSDITLVPSQNITFHGSGATRTVTVTPAPNQSGTAIINVQDNFEAPQITFTVTVNAVNDAPTIANITDRSINEDTNTGAVPFTIGDVETAATALTLTRASSNTTLVPLANVVLGGSGANRTVTVTPAANQSGAAIITVSVSDGTATTTATFLLTVTAVNDAPSFTKGADISLVNNPGAQTVTGWATALSAGPANESTQTLGFTVTNNNNALFNAQPAIAANGTLTFTPATTASGSATITVRINDNGGTTNGGVSQSAAQTFTITSTLPIIVTNTANTGTGSLRQAIANAAINPSAETVTFAPGLSGTIILTSEISITDTAGVIIDASALPAGLTLSGGNTTRHFQVQAGKILTLRGLTLTAGRVTGEGGAVYNAGTLNLDRCTFSGNVSTSNGGAIASIGTLSLTNCTLSGNSATGTGGGLFSNGTSTVLFSTISGNTAVEGGGIAILKTCHLTASIVAGNTATTALPNLKGTLTTNSKNLTTGDPLIAPLGAFGGTTFTMPPLPGSPAINAASGNTRTADQRGFPSVGFPDIGAAEFQGNTDLRHFWNTDWDGDGSPFGLEFALGTNPQLSDPSSPNNLVLSAASNGNPVITFGRNAAANSSTTWRLTRSTTLLEGSFTEIFRFTGPTGTPTTTGSTFVGTATTFQITDNTPPSGKAFYRIEAISP